MIQTASRLVLVPLLLQLLIGCEVDVISPIAKAPYPVVHCILNQYDTAHYVRLTKTFSGGADAFEMAHNLDSLYFKEARVFFDIRGISQLHTVELQPTWEVNREPGIFPVDSLLLYKTKERITGSVRLRIEIPEIQTTVIGWSGGGGHLNVISPKPGAKKELAFYETEPVRIQWEEYEEGISETTIRLRYENVSQGQSEKLYFDWKRKGCDVALPADDYMKLLAVWIKEDPKIDYRKLLGIDIIITCGTSPLKAYLTYKDWGIDIIEKPWSNLVNAYGILAAIGRDTLTDYLPNQKFIDSLVNGSITKQLKFVKWLSPKFP